VLFDLPGANCHIMTTECSKAPLLERMRAAVVAHDIAKIERRLHTSRHNTMDLVYILAHLAVICPSLPVLTFLLENDRFNVDIHRHLSTSGVTMLHFAAAHGHMAIVKYLVAKGANINQLDTYGGNAFHCAAARGTQEAVEYFVSLGVDVNQPDNLGETALHKALEHTNVIDYLVQCEGIEIDAVDNDGDTALHSAATYGLDSAGESLIKGGANVHLRNQTDNSTPLHCAVCEEHESFVALLVKHNADINALGSTDSDGIHWTALCMAIRDANLSMVRRLVQLGADVNRANSVGEMPLHLATWFSDVSTLRFLIDHGADPNLRDADGATPLHCAALKNSETRTSFFLNLNIDIDAQTNIGDTPLHFAAENYGCVAALLMEHGASVHICNERGDTPLHNAAHAGHVDAAAKLFKHGAEIDVCNKCGSTPLHVACWDGAVDMITFLVKNGASVLRRNPIDGCLPLDDAIANEQFEAVQLVSNIMRALEHDRLLSIALLLRPLNLPVLVTNSVYRCLPPTQFANCLVTWFDGWNVLKKIKQLETV